MISSSFWRVQARARRRKMPTAKRMWPRTARLDSSGSGMRVGGGVASGFSCGKLDAESLPDGGSGLGVWRLVQGGEDGFDGVFGGEVGGVDGEAGETGVER